MTPTDFLARRNHAANAAFERFELPRGLAIEATGGWEVSMGVDTMVRSVFARTIEGNAKVDSSRLSFTVEFHTGTHAVKSAYALDARGNLVGNTPLHDHQGETLLLLPALAAPQVGMAAQPARVIRAQVKPSIPRDAIDDANATLFDQHLRVGLTVSTSHVHFATSLLLDDESSELFRALSVINYAGNGWVILVSDDAITECNRLGYQDLVRMLMFARAAGASQVCFDEAAMVLPEAFGLPAFDWDEESSIPSQASSAPSAS